MPQKPRAYTAEEARSLFLDQVRSLARYWANVPHKTPQEMCDGLAFSILNIFDGTSVGYPAVDLHLSPHPDDRAFHQGEGSNWFEPDMLINDCHLHELYYGQGKR